MSQEMPPEEYEAVSNWLRNTFPDGQCPMCQTRFYTDDPTYMNAVLNRHGESNYIFRCQSCAYVMAFDVQLVGQFQNPN